MRILKYLLLAAIIGVSAQAMSQTGRNVTVPKMYIFGFAASFNDSIVHFTEIQELDSVWIDHKLKLMAGREHYSNQLREYLTDNLHMPHRTCVVMYNQNRQKLEKEYLKMKYIYMTGQKKAKKEKKQGNVVSHNDLRIITTNEFKFRLVDMSGPTNE